MKGIFWATFLSAEAEGGVGGAVEQTQRIVMAKPIAGRIVLTIRMSEILSASSLGYLVDKKKHFTN